MSRLSHFLDNRLTDGGEVVSLMRRPPFTPRKIRDSVTDNSVLSLVPNISDGRGSILSVGHVRVTEVRVTFRDSALKRQGMFFKFSPLQANSRVKTKINQFNGAKPFLRSRQLCSYSRTSQHSMEPEDSLPRT
jgi:hypothetical protein